MKHSSYDAIDIYLHLWQYRLELFVRTTNKFDRSNRCTARRQVQQFLHQQFPHFETLKKKKKKTIIIILRPLLLVKSYSVASITGSENSLRCEVHKDDQSIEAEKLNLSKEQAALLIEIWIRSAQHRWMPRIEKLVSDRQRCNVEMVRSTEIMSRFSGSPPQWRIFQSIGATFSYSPFPSAKQELNLLKPFSFHRLQ